jgi:hypothetical protein
MREMILFSGLKSNHFSQNRQCQLKSEVLLRSFYNFFLNFIKLMARHFMATTHIASKSKQRIIYAAQKTSLTKKKIRIVHLSMAEVSPLNISLYPSHSQGVENGRTRDCQLSPNAGFKFIPAPRERRILAVNPELANFQHYIGAGISGKAPSSYKQILPKRIFIEANRTFSSLSLEDKNFFIRLLNLYDAKSTKSPSDIFAISTLFSVLAYEENFAKYFRENSSAKVLSSLDRSQEFFEAERQF